MSIGFAKNWLGALLLAATTLLAPHAASASTLDDILAKGKITIGIGGGLEPWAVVDADNNWTGFDPDVARLIADALGVELEIVPTDGPNRLPYLLSGRVDAIVSVLGITLDRAKQIAFSHPYSAIDVVIVADKSVKLETAADLKGLRIAVAREASHAQLVHKIAPEGTDILTFDDASGQLLAVINGQADAIAGGKDLIEKIRKGRPDLNPEVKILLHRQFNAVGVRREDTDLLRYIDTVLAYHSNSTSVLLDLQKKYLGSSEVLSGL